MSQNLSEYFKKNKNKEIINLNSGTLSQSPDLVIEAKFKHYLEYEKNTTYSLFQTWTHLWKVQTELSQFLKAQPTDLFLRHNITEALNDLILGMSLAPGEIAYTDLEYGAIINICRLKAQRENRPLRQLPLSEYLFSAQKMNLAEAGDEAVDWLISQLKPETRLLLVSHVMTLNGLILPIEVLAAETSNRGIYLVVDGAHAIGSLPLDFLKFQNVSAYAGNLHKWMMSPKGAGFGWLHPQWQSQYEIQQGTWTSFEARAEYEVFGNNSNFALKTLTSHCQDFSSWYAIEDTLNFWQAQGADKIRNQIGALKFQVRQSFEALGWRCVSPQKNSWGPLTAFHAPSALTKKYGSALTLGILKDYKVQISTPQSPKGEVFLRFSPHIINSFEEILRAQTVFKD